MRSIYLLRSMCTIGSMCTSREYVYYIGPLKGSIWNAGSQKCCKITWKIRGWMEEMLQIACKYEAGHQKCCKLHAKRRGWGIIWGPIPWGADQRHGTRQHISCYLCVNIYTYIHTYIYIYTYIHTYVYIYIYIYTYLYIYTVLQQVPTDLQSLSTSPRLSPSCTIEGERRSRGAGRGTSRLLLDAAPRWEFQPWILRNPKKQLKIGEKKTWFINRSLFIRAWNYHVIYGG